MNSKSIGRLLGAVILGISMAGIQSASAQTPYFGHAILGINGVDLNGNTIHVDSFNSASPLASDNGIYSPAFATANARVSTGSSILSIGNSKIAGYVSVRSGGAAFYGSAGAVGDLEYLAMGNIGIQPGHLMDGPSVSVPDVEAPFSSGMSPLLNQVITTSTVFTNTSSTNLGSYAPPPNTLSSVTNVVATNSTVLPSAGTYVGSVITNFTSVTQGAYPAGNPGPVTTNLAVRTTTTYPAFGTYVGNVTTNTIPGRGGMIEPPPGTYVPGTLVYSGGRWTWMVYTYTYQAIVSYTYALPVYSYDRLLSFTFTFETYTTNNLNESFSYVFHTGDYVVPLIDGKILVLGQARILIQGSFSLTGSEFFRVANGGSAEIYCAGESANFGGSGIRNLSGKANKFMYFGLPTNRSLNIGGSGEAAGCFYAPQASASFSAGGSVPMNIMGSIVAGSVTMNGHLRVHFDEALLNGPSWASSAVSIESSSLTPVLGSPLTLSATVTGEIADTFQWQYRGIDLVGETNAALHFPTLRLSYGGSYSCVISNSTGVYESDPFMLTVQLPAVRFQLAAGVYNGLFSPTNDLAHERSGFFTCKITTNGRFSGKLMFDGDSMAATGAFSSNGVAAVTINRDRFGKSPLSLRLETDFLDRLEGAVTNTSWQADLLAYSGYVTTNTVAGVDSRYTMLFPTVEGTTSTPTGTGYSLLNVKRGKISAAGYLADGHALRQTVNYSKSGHWPYYSYHYLGTNFVTNALGVVKAVRNYRGSTIGWLTLSNATPSGTLVWQMPTGVNRHYPSGLTNEASILGSSYTPPIKARLLSLTNGVISFTGLPLTEPISQSFSLKTNNATLMASTNNRVRLSMVAASGSFSGNFMDGTNRILFKGAVLQNQKIGGGYFSPTNGGGKVSIEAAD